MGQRQLLLLLFFWCLRLACRTLPSRPDWSSVVPSVQDASALRRLVDRCWASDLSLRLARKTRPSRPDWSSVVLFFRCLRLLCRTRPSRPDWFSVVPSVQLVRRLRVVLIGRSMLGVRLVLSIFFGEHSTARPTGETLQSRSDW